VCRKRTCLKQSLTAARCHARPAGKAQNTKAKDKNVFACSYTVRLKPAKLGKGRSPAAVIRDEQKDLLNISMRLVLDTSVIVSAVRSRRGASNKLLEMAFLRSFQMLATPALFLEYEEVLARKEQRAVHGMTPDRMNAFLIGLAVMIEPVRIFYQWRPQMQDADDEMVLETAINGRADAIVTHNSRDFVVAASRFKVRVLSPSHLIEEVAQ
jgi:putative PIN family toxin of toxin-antitoxin system